MTEDIRDSWDAATRARIDAYHERRKNLSEYGAANILEWLKERNEQHGIAMEGEEVVPGGGWGMDILIHETAGHDTAGLPTRVCDGNSDCSGEPVDFADAIMGLRGFQLTAAIGEPVLRAYLYHLFEHLGLGWCKERREMADCLMAMYKRSGNSIPTEWTEDEFKEWWSHPW